MNHLSYPAMRDSLRVRRKLIAVTVTTAVLALSGEASAQYVSVNSTGSAAHASGTDGIAVGSAATAAGSDSTAIGTNARVYPTTDTGSMALGYGAKVAPGGATTSSGNLAIGVNAAGGGNTAGDISNAIAIGTSAVSERSGGSPSAPPATTPERQSRSAIVRRPASTVRLQSARAPSPILHRSAHRAASRSGKTRIPAGLARHWGWMHTHRATLSRPARTRTQDGATLPSACKRRPRETHLSPSVIRAMTRVAIGSSALARAV